MLLEEKKGIIFDLDDTLVETDPNYIERIVNLTLKKLGYNRKASMEECSSLWYGINKEEKIKKMWGLNPRFFWETFRRYDTVEGRMENTRIHDDVKALENLDKELRIAVLTSATEKIALAEMDLLQPYLKISYSVIIDSYGHIKDKPEPDGIYKSLELLGIKSKEAIMVGDSESDILAAQAANVLDILVKRGNKRPMECKPTVVIPNLYYLKNVA